MILFSSFNLKPLHISRDFATETNSLLQRFMLNRPLFSPTSTKSSFILLLQMIQKSNQIPQTDRRILSFPAVHPSERISPSTLLDSLIPLSHKISSFNPKFFATQRRNSREAIRQIGILLIFFEEIRDRALTLPDSLVLSFSELHLTFQKIFFLLEDCSKEGSKLWILVKCQFIATQFRVLIRAIATALDVLPIYSIVVCGEVKELVELVAKQARKVKIEVEPSDEQAMNQLISILNHFQTGIEPDPEFIKLVLDYLGIKTWCHCNYEINFLENEIDFYSESEEREVPFLNSLLGFMYYNRVVLFRTGEGQTRGDTIDAKINAESLNGLNPEDFRCPISLDLMTDPVIVATGQTYDRSSIQTWLKAGKMVCPKTGERLTNTELVPNTALRKLIHQFCADNGISLSKSRKQNREIACTIVAVNPVYETTMKFLSRCLARNLVLGSEEDKNKAAYEIRLLAKSNVLNRSCLVEAGVIPELVNMLSSSSYKLVQENAIGALLKLSKHANGKKEIVETGGIKPILGVLKTGLSMEAKQTAAATIFYLSSVKAYRKVIGESADAIESLVELIKEGTNCGKKNAVVAIFALILYPKNKKRVIEGGLVPVLINVIVSSEKSELVADSLAVLAELAETIDGTFVILKASPLPLLTRILHSSSAPRAAKEYCVTILLALSRNGGDEVVRDLATDTSLMGSLYSLVTEGTSRAGKRACSLIDILQESIPSSGVRN